VKNLLKYIHGENPTPRDFFLVHVLPFMLAGFYRFYHADIFQHWSFIQMLLYYVFASELIGGFFANLSVSTKLFWATQPLKNKFIFVFLHAWQPIAWFLFFKCDVRFGFAIFIYAAVSTIILLKISDKLLLPLSLLFTFIGIYFSTYLSNHFNFMPYGLEWVPIAYFLKLIFAFTIKYKN